MWDSTGRGYRLKYRAYVPDLGGWLPYVYGNSDYAGTTDRSARVESVEIKIANGTTDVTSNYAVVFRVHMQNKGWLPWVISNPTYRNNSDFISKLGSQYGIYGIDTSCSDAGIPGSGLRVEAIQMYLIKIG